MIAFFQRLAAFFISIVLVVSNYLGVDPTPLLSPVDDFKVTTYIVRNDALNPTAIHACDFDIITDIIIFGIVTFNNKGEVIYNETEFETAITNIRNAINGRDINITVNLLGPGGQTDSTVWEEQMEAQSVEHNKAFTSGVLEDNIIKVLDKYKLDGVHFDYEYPLSDKAWKHFNKFLVSLDRKLGDYTLGVACSVWNINFTTAAIGAVDTFELMTYDFLDEEGRHATYDGLVANTLKTGLDGLPQEKTNLGLPFYSRPSDLDAYWYGYNGYCESLDENGWYHCENINKDFWFNTPDVIEKKTDYAIKSGFGGVMIWHYGCDLPSTNEKSLLRAIGTAINN